MGGYDTETDFEIFYTDYENFEISYSCWTRWWIFKYEMLAIGSREKKMSAEMYQKARDVITSRLPLYSEYLYDYSALMSGFLSYFKTWDVSQGEDCEYEWLL